MKVLNVSIPCLAGHSFSLRMTERDPMDGGPVSQSPVWRGIHSHKVIWTGDDMAIVASQSPVWRGIHSHPKATR